MFTEEEIGISPTEYVTGEDLPTYDRSYNESIGLARWKYGEDCVVADSDGFPYEKMEGWSDSLDPFWEFIHSKLRAQLVYQVFRDEEYIQFPSGRKTKVRYEITLEEYELPGFNVSVITPVDPLSSVPTALFFRKEDTQKFVDLFNSYAKRSESNEE